MHLNDSFCAGKTGPSEAGVSAGRYIVRNGGCVWERRTTFLPYRQVAHAIVEKRPDRKISS